jgi:ribonuclease HI
MAKNFYAIRKGKHPGIYTSWEECKKNLGSSKKRRLRFKGFDTLAEAEEFMEGIPWTPYERFMTNETLMKKIGDKPYAFVDGSYNKETETYGYGGFLVTKDQRYVLQGSGNDKDIASMWNVAGELCGAIAAIKKAIELELPEIFILYDYLGIEMWATGQWKRKREKTKEYFQFITDVMPLIDIKFVKVPAHSGIEGNEEADRLAKIAVGLNPDEKTKKEPAPKPFYRTMYK